MWPDQEDTEHLLDAAAAGRAGAVEALLEQHRAALRRVVAARIDPGVQARIDASDVVQEVLLEAHRRLQLYLAERKLPFHLWLRCLARDRVVDAQRKHHAGMRDVARDAHLGSAALVDRSTLEIAAELVAAGPSPVSLAMREELALRVAAALTELTEDDREVLVMRHHEQLGNQEVAAILGIGESAAAMRYVRALRRLRARIVQDETERT